jgi:hypothetical protein
MNETSDQSGGNHFSKRHPRTTGIISLLAGACLAKWQIYDALHAAEQGKESVSFNGKLAVMSIGFIVFSVPYIIFGRKFEQWFKLDLKNVGWRNAIIYAGTAIVAVAIVEWVKKSLVAQGYR